MPLLAVKDLKVYYRTRDGVNKAVDGISFKLDEGQTLGFVGESGCGKTTTGRAIIRVLPGNAFIAGGKVSFKGEDLTAAGEDRMRRLRWREIAAVPQSAMDSLDPVYRVGDQFVEVLARRGGMKKKEARERARELFGMVGLDIQRLQNYPHEFSGGMKQRAVIAMALALNPSLIIADEPVTALDVIVQRQVLNTLKRLKEQFQVATIMITHDISVVAESCDQIAIMYAGKIVEYGLARSVLKEPFHPYNLGLQNAFPNLVERKDHLVSVEGQPPSLIDPPVGCRFEERCPFARERCEFEEPEIVEVQEGHFVACHFVAGIDVMRVKAREVTTWQQQSIQ